MPVRQRAVLRAPARARNANGCLADIPSAAAALKWALQKRRSPIMSQHALIRGEVCFRAGDGVMMPIPPGPVEIDVAEDSVTLAWTDGKGNRGSTAITPDEYERYTRE